jgi:hypothetical protein
LPLRQVSFEGVVARNAHQCSLPQNAVGAAHTQLHSLVLGHTANVWQVLLKQRRLQLYEGAFALVMTQQVLLSLQFVRSHLKVRVSAEISRLALVRLRGH